MSLLNRSLSVVNQYQCPIDHYFCYPVSVCACFLSVRDWSLITGRGGLQNGRGGAREVLPLRKGGRKKF